MNAFVDEDTDTGTARAAAETFDDYVSCHGDDGSCVEYPGFGKFVPGHGILEVRFEEAQGGDDGDYVRVVGATH